MKKQSSRFRLHAGTASILLVFVTLCLISFAVLSLVNATADLRLSQKIAERNTAYYEAVTEAEQFVADADAQLLSVAGQHDSQEAFAEAVQSSASSLGLSARFPISDVQYLEVVLEPVLPSAEDTASKKRLKASRIVSYRICTDETLLDIPEDTLNLPH